ncbi:MAG: DUF3341 domain-containing protein [Candidatus Hydrogenedentes bacterium]|nr:DUF3341 domain-containing protein [Candidatus Hydrogenedentota bacterium]
MSDAHVTAKAGKTYGLIAEFNTPEELLAATEKAYKTGYRKMDAYSPMPIEGLGEKLGLRRTGVPSLVFIGGLTGAATGFGLQWFATTVHYPYHIGGKPFFSWPAYIPITFELMILFAAFACFFGLLGLCGLPQPWHPIFNAKRFERASSDGFFLCIESTDPQFDMKNTWSFLEAMGPVEVSEVQA